MIKNECGHAYKLLNHAECLWCENCVEKLVARLKKPQVTEKWIGEKVLELFVVLNILKPSLNDENNAKTFIRLLYLEAGCQIGGENEVEEKEEGGR